MSQAPLYAYLHGFGSSPTSPKALHMAATFKSHGLALHRPDIHHPSFRDLTFTGALAALDAMDAEHRGDGRRWCLVGSSMGGYLAARWAEIHPERVERLVLLCPGFDLLSRWPELVGARRMETWQERGYLNLPDMSGRMQPVKWRFIEDSRSHPRFPEVPCEALIIHGTNDLTVPVESSRFYSSSRDHVRLIEVDDDHTLGQSLKMISEETMAFFGVEAWKECV